MMLWCSNANRIEFPQVVRGPTKITFEYAKSIETLPMLNKHTDECAENPSDCIKDRSPLSRVWDGMHEKDCIANRSDAVHVLHIFFLLHSTRINYRPFENPDGILRVYIFLFSAPAFFLTEQRNMGDIHSLLLVASPMALTCHSILYAAI